MKCSVTRDLPQKIPHTYDDQQTWRWTSTSKTGPDCSAEIKEELEDDCAQTVEKQSTGECDMKQLDLPFINITQTVINQSTDGSDIRQLDMPFINITPIVTNQSDICKTEDGPKVKLERHKLGCPLYEPSEMSTIKREFGSTIDCSKITKEQSSPTTASAQTDDGFQQLIEVSGEIDGKVDVSDVDDQISVGTVMYGCYGGVEQKETSQVTKVDDAECTDSNKLEGMYKE